MHVVLFKIGKFLYKLHNSHKWLHYSNFVGNRLTSDSQPECRGKIENYYALLNRIVKNRHLKNINVQVITCFFLVT